MTDRTCSVDDCDIRVYGHGLCQKHYWRMKRHGDPLVEYPAHRRIAPPEERFWPKVDKSGDCWVWTAALDGFGYGMFYLNRSKPHEKAHRFAWESVNGEIPEGLVIDHLCRNPKCVNPSHLEPVTQQTNVIRGMAGLVSHQKSVRRTHCKRGHEMTLDNSYVPPSDTHRRCRACAAENARKYRKAKKNESDNL